MRTHFLRNAYRNAVQHFGPDRYRRAFNCMTKFKTMQPFASRTNPVSLRLASIVTLKDSLQTSSGVQTNLHDILDGTGIVGELTASLCGLVDRVNEKSLIALLRQINTAHNKFRESAMVDDLLSTCFDNYQCMLPLLRTFVWVIGTSNTSINYI
ncbi:hypothetical protein BmR1_04g08810 [Babesia microti strain RI]|uniref:Uncharacterized protein n=1 Tax=Babesia microti (strain RI) TaxID=1133968 RepID=A0A1N6LY80_BABMR|nr:hypothetical protein BmR1_04g08810 [Babesia microti strain RI]SIO73840.1 hypothetical protein BmR1_04g08810 [Babesia microti strain RI]|eukprot:XP_021337895.1 hypothetical protein BmR1_04g08810 [Babesia microti strain RI]